MTRHDSARHGSAESSLSSRSQDTVRANRHGMIRTTPIKLRTDGRLDSRSHRAAMSRKDSEVSPSSSVSKLSNLNSHPLPPTPNALSDIAPWETSSRTTDYGHFRRDPGFLDSPSPRIPSIAHHAPTSNARNPPWAGPNGAPIGPSSVFGSIFDDGSDEFAALSSGRRPGSGPAEERGYGEDRRPSVASATTVSSNNSKSSIGRAFNKKFHGIFNHEEGPMDSRQTSDSSLAAAATTTHLDQQSQRTRHRNTSINNLISTGLNSRPVSPSSSRPRTPLPTSDVTPWVYQDAEITQARNLEHHGSFTSEPQSTKPQHHKGMHGHKFHIHPRKHREEEHRSNESAGTFGSRPTTGREDSATSIQRDFHTSGSTVGSSIFPSDSSLGMRPGSPTPSMSSTPSHEYSMHGSPEAPGGKRSLLDKFRRKEKNERAPPNGGQNPLKGLPASSVSLQQSLRTANSPTSAPMPPIPPDTPQPQSLRKKASRGNGLTSRDREEKPRKQSTAKGMLRGKRHHHMNHPTKDPNEAMANQVGNNNLWSLDTDLSDMNGIINPYQPSYKPPENEIFAGPLNNEEQPQEAKKPEPVVPGAAAVNGRWAAPDSWIVKQAIDENVGRLREFDEDGGLMTEENLGPPHCVRIFRQDSTFAVLSVGLNTSVAEIIQILGKKTFLQDELDNYHILMKKHDTTRQLEPSERPLAIQKRLLEQAGYTDADRLEDVGREDNSYLCRFTFLPAKMCGYSSLDRDPGFHKMHKFNHIDLQGRNLITIPIALYQRANEIISLNLSRNLSLDVPKDFIQGCANLRDIRYTGNEAWKLPKSLSLAMRLQSLDVSNNRLEQLEHAELNKLQSLVSLRLSNNKLSRLPKYFGNYKALRSLNLSSNSLSEFPNFLCDLKTLVDLDVSFNSISTIPDIGRLTSLERFWATNNKMSGSFPPCMSNLVNLRDVDVRFNALDNIDVLAQLPRLENLMVGHNSISSFEGSFARLRILLINHNPVTRFEMNAPVLSLSILNLASAKLAHLPDDLFGKVSGLTKLILDKNHFSTLSPHIGRLYRLEYLSLAKNDLSVLPAEIGRLGELRYLDVRENNLNHLPAEIWLAKRLESLNVSSNVLDVFPKPGAVLPTLPGESADNTPTQTPGLGPATQDDAAARRPSQASGFLSIGSSPGGQQQQRKGSSASLIGGPAARKGSVATATRAPTNDTITPTVSRKDSSFSNRMMTTFAGSLKSLSLADNRLNDDIFDELALLPELRVLNLSYNLIYDLPARTLRRWSNLVELYLSGNDLTSLPADEFEEVSSLKVLHINGNKFQVLPAELGKVQKLATLDAGSNALKYNVCNWPYDWNWNWNRNLKYLNLSGNKRLEIKPSGSYNAAGNRDGKDLTDFTSLNNLRILGLMDVTLMVPSSIPDQSEDRRIRTSGSTVGNMGYGMADSLGRHEHLSTMDMIVPKFRSHDDETLIGMFDGQSLSSGGSKISKFLYEHFKHRFADELERRQSDENPADALRRTYLGLGKELATAATQPGDMKGPDPMTQHRPSVTRADLGDDDVNSGSTATVLFLKETELYVSNVGDIQALLIHSEGSHKVITRKHDPAEAGERQRIRDAGGFVSRQGKLNDVLEVSRAFGFAQLTPAVIAAPHISQISIRESDEMILLASRELWDYITPDLAVDIARDERGDLMRAAQKLRDLAIAFGASGKIMVMILGVANLREKRKAAIHRTHSMSMGPSGLADELFPYRPRKKGRDAVADSKLARLDLEVEAPTGDVSLVFTDIKNSTLLWETYPIAMRSAIRMHNELMRRQLRIIGGYEVKTEGDAFMVAFSTVTSALLWCFTVQSQLLDVQWPEEILKSVSGEEVVDGDGNVIFRGLSVRMGVHWGSPVCETDPVTKRMDYFGPMVNRAARISSVADGGQITVSSDFIAEVQRLLETHFESDRSGSAGSEEGLEHDRMNQAIQRELRSLSSQGFEVKDLGERRLKGLENPEYIYLMYPHSLASRLVVQQERADAEAATAAQISAANAGAVSGLLTDSAGGNATTTDSAGTKSRDSTLTIDTEHIWSLWNLSLRLEMLCSALESRESKTLKAPETALLERTKNRGGEINDTFLLGLVEHQVSRIESCINTLALRHMVRPFGQGKTLLSQACPIVEVFAELNEQLAELARLKAEKKDARRA